MVRELDSTQVKGGVQYHSCVLFERLNLSIVGTDKYYLTVCCEGVSTIPRIEFSTPEKSIEQLKELRDNIVVENIKFSLRSEILSPEERKYTKGCLKCSHYKLGNWVGDGLVHIIVFGMYPAPCQSKCIYCIMRGGDDTSRFTGKPNADEFKRVFDALDYAKKSGLIAKSAIWQVGVGEITIHPFKERIYDLTEGTVVQYLSNCFVYDERIAKSLAANQRATIVLAIDSGTPETWFKIKGVDNFNTVLSNLQKYHNHCEFPWQIVFKYLVLPGINDNVTDYHALIEIMKSLKINSVIISADRRSKYSDGIEKRGMLVKSAVKLASILVMNGMKFSINHVDYKSDEIKQITLLADEG